jgi:hypothetical protein
MIYTGTFILESNYADYSINNKYFQLLRDTDFTDDNAFYTVTSKCWRFRTKIRDLDYCYTTLSRSDGFTVLGITVCQFFRFVRPFDRIDKNRKTKIIDSNRDNNISFIHWIHVSKDWRMSRCNSSGTVIVSNLLLIEHKWNSNVHNDSHNVNNVKIA